MAVATWQISESKRSVIRLKLLRKVSRNSSLRICFVDICVDVCKINPNSIQQYCLNNPESFKGHETEDTNMRPQLAQH